MDKDDFFGQEMVLSLSGDSSNVVVLFVTLNNVVMALFLLLFISLSLFVSDVLIFFTSSLRVLNVVMLRFCCCFKVVFT